MKLGMQSMLSLIPRPPRPTGERRSGTVASNSSNFLSTHSLLINILIEWKGRVILGPRI